MKCTIENKKLENYVIDLAIRASKESKIHPVDRVFLNRNLEEIQSFDPVEFLYYNFELENALYTNQLLVCLPELWHNITLSDILKMSDCFTNVHSYFSLIKFTYKYIEVSIIEQVLLTQTVNESKYLKNQILQYLHLQWNTLLKNESDLEDFEDGFIGVSIEEWVFIKQKLLLDEDIQPALLDLSEIKLYIDRIILKFKRNEDQS